MASYTSFVDSNGTVYYRAVRGAGTTASPYEQYTNDADLNTATGTQAQAPADKTTLTTTGTTAYTIIQLLKGILINSGGSSSSVTQYADGATAATPTGNVVLGNKSGTIKALQIDTNNYLQVSAPDLTNKLGSVGDTGNSSGTILQQLRLIGESLSGNRATTTTAISASASGDNTIVSGTAGKKIAISSLVFVVDAAVNITLKDGASTSISGAMPIAEHDVNYQNPMILSTGNNFVINLSATANIRGYVIWYLI